VDSRGCLSPSRTAVVVTQLDQVMAPGHKSVSGPGLRTLCGVLSFLSAVGTVGATHISPLWQALGSVRGSSHHCDVIRQRARGACVWWRDVLMGASCLRSGLSTWVCDPMVPCTWSSVCGATPAGSGAGARVSEPQAVFGCGEWSDSEKGPAGHGGAGVDWAVLFTLLCVGPMVGGAQVVWCCRLTMRGVVALVAEGALT